MIRKVHLIFFNMWLIISNGQGDTENRRYVGYDEKFHEVMRSLKLTVDGAKIYYKVYEPQEFAFERCPLTLHNIIAEKMKCNKIEEEMKPKLLLSDSFLHIRQLYDRNCTSLTGKNLKSCKEALAGRPSTYFVEGDLNKKIDACYTQERGNHTNYLKKREIDCQLFVIMSLNYSISF